MVKFYQVRMSFILINNLTCYVGTTGTYIHTELYCVAQLNCFFVAFFLKSVVSIISENKLLTPTHLTFE